MSALRRLAFAVMAFFLSLASLAENGDGSGGPGLRPAADPDPAATNYSDIWWNPNESGWGLTIADHETQLFAVWYTYDFGGRPTWFVIPGGGFTQGRRFFAGTVYQTRGPCYRYDSFDPAQVTASQVGTANIDFAPPDLPAGWARFSGLIGTTSWSKAITRQPFGIAVPSWGTDYTDIWWNSAESGWGLALSQHGNNIFGVLFTYDCDGSPLFVALPGVAFQSPTSFSGTLYTTTSSAGWWGSHSFAPSGVTVTPVGSAQVAFTGRSGQFSYTINGSSRTRRIDQQPFGNARPASPPPTTTTRTLTVGRSGTGSGSVASTPSGISCGATCSASFTNGATVVLTASPSAGSNFAGWGGDCTGTGTCTLAMSASHGVTATFNANTAPPPGARACTGRYSMTVNIAFMGCTNATHTFAGDLEITGIDFDAVSRNAPSQFAGLLSVTNVSDVFAGFPGECRPVDLREVQAPFTGFMNISRIGSADATILGEELHFQFSLGSMNAVLGTITGPEVTTGHFSCNY